MNKAHSLLLKDKNKTPNLKPKLGYCVKGRYKELRLRGQQCQAPNSQRDAHTQVGCTGAACQNSQAVSLSPVCESWWGWGETALLSCPEWRSRTRPTGKDSQSKGNIASEFWNKLFLLQGFRPQIWALAQKKPFRFSFSGKTLLSALFFSLACFVLSFSFPCTPYLFSSQSMSRVSFSILVLGFIHQLSDKFLVLFY